MKRNWFRWIVVLLAVGILGLEPAAGGQVCAFSGPPDRLPRTASGDLDLSALGSPKFIRVVGCGGGGGGAGAGMAPNDGYGPSGAGGAGAHIVAYLNGPLNNASRLPVEIGGDGAGGCGGGVAHADCPNVPSTPPSARAPREGEPGRSGTTVKIGAMVFRGGDGGGIVEGWTYPSYPPPRLARGGHLDIPGGDGGTINLKDPTGGTSTSKWPGGAIGARPTDGKGHGGIPGGGGGASLVAAGGRGGSAGSGDGKWTGALNNAGNGEPGGICAGGGGGGAAAGGTFPGGNGGQGGQGWIVIYSITDPQIPGPAPEPFPGDLSQFGLPCPLPPGGG